MERKNNNKNLISDEDFVQVEDADDYYVDEESGLAVKETYTDEDREFDDSYDISDDYIEYDLIDEENDFMETLSEEVNLKSKMSIEYYKSEILKMLDPLERQRKLQEKNSENLDAKNVNETVDCPETFNEFIDYLFSTHKRVNDLLIFITKAFINEFNFNLEFTNYLDNYVLCETDFEIETMISKLVKNAKSEELQNYLVELFMIRKNIINLKELINSKTEDNQHCGYKEKKLFPQRIKDIYEATCEFVDNMVKKLPMFIDKNRRGAQNEKL